MFRRINQTRKTASALLLLTFVALIAAPTAAMAQEPDVGKGLGSMGDEASKQAHDIVNLVKRAFNNDKAAITELINTKVIPALLVVAGLFFAWTIASAIGRAIGGVVSKKVDLTLGKFLTKAIRNALFFLVLMGVFQYCGGDITAFAAIIAALGFAVGMALQGTLGNIASGIMLLLFRPFKVNDYIVIADTAGTVEEIDLFTTRINTLDNRHIIVPNGEIFGSKLENYTRNQLRRVDVNVGASYNADLDHTRAALERAVAKSGGVAEPAGYVYLMELGASSVDWQLRTWCDAADYWAVREALTANAKKEMDKAGIGIPYPQLDVHVGGKLLAKSA